MKIRALTLGAVVGFVVAFAPSCSPAKCGPQNCDGCCDSVKNTCVKKPSNNNNTTCGASGNACIDCSATASTCNPATSTCTAGGTGGGTGTGGGGGTTCDGCKLPSGTCVPSQNSSTNVSNCGIGGVACVACSSGQLCVAGACAAPDAGAGIGDACNTDADCVGVPLTAEDRMYNFKAFCKKNALDVTAANGVGAAYVGGYCTKRCGFEETQTTSSCGLPKSQCSYFLGDLGEGDNSCFKTCTNDNDCRTDYFCLQGAGAQGGNLCMPMGLLATLPDGGLTINVVDAGPGFPGEAGAPCADTAACQPPAGGACIAESRDAGFVGGACTAECTGSLSNDVWCGTGGVCSPAYAGDDSRGPVIRWFCERGCGPLGDGGVVGTCRDGYACEGTNRFATCTPKCTNSGVSCRSGTTCNTTTGLCN